LDVNVAESKDRYIFYIFFNYKFNKSLELVYVFGLPNDYFFYVNLRIILLVLCIWHI